MKTNKKLMMVSLLCSIVFGLEGCTTSYNFTVPPNNKIALAEKIPISVGIVLSSDFCSYSYSSTHQGNTNIFYIGKTLCDYTKKIAQQIFSQMIVISDIKDATGQTIDAIITPKVVDSSVFYRTGAIPAKVNSIIVMEWVVKDKNGEILYITTIEGNGLDERTFGGATIRYQTSMQKALDDLFNKTYTEFISSSEIRQFANSLRP